MTSWARDSLRWRAPLFIAAVIIVVVGTFLGVAFREVEATLTEAAGARAKWATDQVAGLLMQSTLQRLGELHRVAAHAAVRAYLQHPADDTREAARRQLATLTNPNPQIIELWNRAGERVLSLALPPSAEHALPAGSMPSAAGIGGFRMFGNTMFTEAVTTVDSDVTADDHEPRTSSGFVVVRRPLVASPTADTLSRLVGNGASVKVGNKEGGVWTDLSQAVEAPPVEMSRAGVTAYRTANGQRRIGALAAIKGTPWAVWVEFSLSTVLAPARSSLQRMIVIALGVVLVAGAFAYRMTARITTPLFQLTQASEAMAGGEYSRRVTVSRGDELGRLAVAFNAMSERVEHAHRELEERVRQRTAGLEEAGALLAQRVGELNDSREELNQFFFLTPDMMCIAGMDGRFKRVNAAWHDTLGWTLDDLTSVPYLDFVHPDDLAPTAAETVKLAAGETTMTFENRYRCKDGSYRWLSWRAAPAASRGFIYATARDVTEQKRAAHELAEHAAELVAVNQELEAFSYSVSHDLRAPLRHIGGFATLLAESASASLNAEGHRLLKTIVSAASQMGRLIDDLLAFSRVGRKQLDRSDVNLGDLVRDVRREIMIGVNGQPIVWRLNDLPAVDGDRSLLRLVFVNLLSNAVKYSSTRTPAEVEIGTVPGGAGETVVFVRDNGVGFDRQYAHKLFGVFQRLHTAEEFEGTGIGLANVRRIVHRHGGRVWAESELGQGAAFYVALPIGHTSC
jgi:PAS domain S-box-containing protein